MSDAVFEEKKSKYLKLRERDAMADHFAKEHSTAEVLKLPVGTGGIRTAGRVVGMRRFGKLIFAHIHDFDGRVQLAVECSEGNETSFNAFAEDVSVGDFVGVEGESFLTKKGEYTVRVASWSLLNRCLRPLPEKFHGMQDVELRYRQRYLDLVSNEDARAVARKRIEVVRTLRRYLEDNHFLEVETPVLQTLPSGALARPFRTHHNALDIECTLRIAPETFLKRCIGGGMDRVFEFARCFRNEGISAAHLQDFTMLEFYAAYWNAGIMREFVAKMIRHLFETLFQGQTVKLDGYDVDFAGEWPVWEYAEVIARDCGIDVRAVSDRDALIAEIKAKGIRLEDIDSMNWANIVDTLFKKVSRPKLIQPCFLIKYPAEMAPLARRNREDPRFVDLFQFVVAGVELVKAYSELVDPVDQRERFEEQAKAREGGDEETMPMDEDFLLAMEHGFPPISGVGIGIDRLVTILCGCENIKDAVLFPLLRPEQH